MSANCWPPISSRALVGTQAGTVAPDFIVLVQAWPASLAPGSRSLCTPCLMALVEQRETRQLLKTLDVHERAQAKPSYVLSNLPASVPSCTVILRLYTWMTLLTTISPGVPGAPGFSLALSSQIGSTKEDLAMRVGFGRGLHLGLEAGGYHADVLPARQASEEASPSGRHELAPPSHGHGKASTGRSNLPSLPRAPLIR